jgi:hypothetical protein
MNRLEKITVTLFTISLVFLFNACKCGDKEDILGRYSSEIKGMEIKDTTKGMEAFRYFEIKSDNTFQIFNDENDVKIFGNWNIINCQNVKNNLDETVSESTIEFNYNNIKITGVYRQNRLTFDYPNDFYLGRYKSTWYIKQRKK